jgi:hypothetical protein
LETGLQNGLKKGRVDGVKTAGELLVATTASWRKGKRTSWRTSWRTGWPKNYWKAIKNLLTETLVAETLVENGLG